MPRYVQDPKTNKLVPAEEYYARQEQKSAYVYAQADVQPFQSVVDRSVITSRADLREHNARNGVVHESEFGSARDRASYYARKAAERADFYQGTKNTAYGRQLARERKQHIVDAIRKHER